MATYISCWVLAPFLIVILSTKKVRWQNYKWKANLTTPNEKILIVGKCDRSNLLMYLIVIYWWREWLIHITGLTQQISNWTKMRKNIFTHTKIIHVFDRVCMMKQVLSCERQSSMGPTHLLTRWDSMVGLDAPVPYGLVQLTPHMD